MQPHRRSLPAFSSEVADPQGNSVKISYDSLTRIVSLTDAIGQVTTFCYNDTWQTQPSPCQQPPAATNPHSNLQVTQITDHFGRSAFFSYDSNTGQLTSIKDVLGITSSFVYQTNSDGTKNDFIQSLTTPYGETQFQYGDALTNSTLDKRTRFVSITDPLGRISRVEFRQGGTCDDNGFYETNDEFNSLIACQEQIVPSGPGVTVPNPANLQGVAQGQYLQYRNTFIWDAQEYARSYKSANRYLGAKIIHWLHTSAHNSSSDLTASRIPESIKEPLESRIWFNYPGQWTNPFSPEDPSVSVGATNQPSAVALRP